MSPRADIRLDIQGLRALAVVAVIAFHMQVDWLPGGYLGVDVFFVVSGFVVSRVILQRPEGFAWLGFYANRVRRIVPAYAAMLLVVALLSAVLLVPDDFRLFEKSLRRALLFTSNQHFAQEGDYFAPAAHEWPLLHTWSLAVEMQFYLLLPLILRWTPRRWLSPVLAVLCLAGLAIAQWRLSRDGEGLLGLYYAMSARAPEFLMGAWLASVQQSVPKAPPRLRLLLGLTGLGLMLSAFALLSGNHFSPLAAAWPCVGALMLIAARDDVATGRYLSHRWLVWVGALSYSLYLWHWPLLALARYTWQDPDLPWPLLAAVVLAFSSLAWLSWRWIEQPWLKPQGMKRGTRIAVVAAMMVASLLASRPLNAGVAPTPPRAALRYAPPDTICHGQINGDCQRGATRRHSDLMLLGDSHAAQLNLFMDAFGQEQGFRATVITASSCLPLPGFDDQALEPWAIEPCHRMQQAVKERLSDHRTLLLAGKWSHQVSNPAFARALDAFLDDAGRQQQRVVVLGQLPLLSRNPVRVLRLEALGIHTANTVTPLARDANAQMAAMLRSFPHASFVDFSAHAMFDALPFADGELIYMDAHHLNETGSLRYAQAAGARLAQLLTSTGTPSSP
jgi:peptidoglycan/LPS O-acetylase OafA/YrhL